MPILTRSQIAGLLPFEEYVRVVADAFRAHAEGRSLMPALMQVGAPDGEFHHGISRALVRREDFRGELGELLTGKVRGRCSADEITIFDSTGTALQDVAAALADCQRAKSSGLGVEVDVAQ